MLTFVEKIPLSRNDLWRCGCGTVKPMRTDSIKAGKIKSCGCQKTKTRIVVPKYISRTFTLMKYRCNNNGSSDYCNYGARGISVTYKDYLEFYADVGDRPDDSYTIDRIDVNKNYEIGNCRWASYETQMNNTRTNRLITIGGRTKTVAMLSKEYNIGYTTLRARLDSGMSAELAVSKEIDLSKSNKKEVLNG